MVFNFMSLETFIATCEHSGVRAFDAFKSLLQTLDDPLQRVQGRRFLQELAQYYAVKASVEKGDGEQLAQRLHFSFKTLAVHVGNETPRYLTLLQFPSAFSPEEWSFTFYEGLTRYPLAEFQDRQVVELGCGNGWITLALALRCQPQRIVGVDINPRAVVLARLNLYLNALNDDGAVMVDSEGLSLLDRVEFAESDLLGLFLNKKGALKTGVNPKGGIDRIVGCIPQVLNPDPDVLLSMTPESASDEELYALSNYCDKQGFVEDQFGLGLIARALEESVQLLRPSGKLILNLGGRPGAQVLERMFYRRGFSVRTIWQTKVSQAQDTDILALVNIEKTSSHRFEFFMAPRSDTPICASTAQRYASQGGAIYHALTVYEAELQFPTAVKTLLPRLAGPAFEQARSGLDLSFTDRDIAEERLDFLADLARQLESDISFPYHETEGVTDFRAAIANFLRSYFALSLQRKDVLVAPSREALLRNMLSLFRPGVVLVESSLARLLEPHLLEHQSAIELVEAPRRVDLVTRLLLSLRPQMLITTLADFEAQAREPFALLVDVCARTGVTLIVDISNVLELSSTPAGNGVFQYLSEQAIPAHVVLICDLVKNRVYQDLSVCFALSQDANLHANLSAAAELNYSRTPLLNQYYYRRLLQDLLYFQRPEPETGLLTAPETETGRFALAPAANAAMAFTHPAIVSARLPLNADTVRLDYGENCLPAPTALRAALMESFVRQHLPTAQAELSALLSTLLEQRYGLRAHHAGQFVFGNGIAPLFAHLCQLCAGSGGTLLVPQGAYGHFMAAALYHGVSLRTMATSAQRGFKLDADTLAQACAGVDKPWLYLNAPVVNPTGSFYSRAELDALLKVARAQGITVLMDTVFSGLEFASVAAANAATDAVTALDICTTFNSETGHEAVHGKPLSLLLLGGISKEFSGGGLRFGYAWSRDEKLLAALKSQRPQAPHSTLMNSVRRLYELLLGKDALLLADLQQQRETLQQRAQLMSECLRECGWQPLMPAGGLFMVARPLAYEGKVFSFNTPDGPQTLALSADNIDLALFYSENLLINNAIWTGLPGYCRLVLSVTAPEFESAREKLKAFRDKVLG